MEVTGRLVRAAPDYSYAHSLHAVAMSLVATEPNTSRSEFEALSREIEAASRRALQLDRRNGEAYLALGSRYAGRGHWLEQEQNFERAAQLSPTLRVVRSRYVRLLRDVGRWKAAEAMSRRYSATTSASRPVSS